MSGIVQQLPPEAIGPAVGAFIYSVVCFSLSAALLWATVAHREWKSCESHLVSLAAWSLCLSVRPITQGLTQRLLPADVAMLAFFTSLSTLASLAQQLHTYLRWTSIKIEQYDYVKANLGNPELSVAGPSVGVDIVLFYIRTSRGNRCWLH